MIVTLRGRQFQPEKFSAGLSCDENAFTLSLRLPPPLPEVFSCEDLKCRMSYLGPEGHSGSEEIALTPFEEGGLSAAWILPPEALLFEGVLKAELQAEGTKHSRRILWHSRPLHMKIEKSLEDERAQAYEKSKYRQVQVHLTLLDETEEPRAHGELSSDTLSLHLSLPRGKSGNQVKALGCYATLEELISSKTNPQAGDVYAVGTQAPYEFYLFSNDSWVSLGTFQGEAGPKGEDAPPPEDEKISSSSTWSSEKILKTFCPPFEKSGETVSCSPLPLSPLSLSCRLLPRQSGEGTPSFQNVRPISCWENLSLLCGAQDGALTPQANLLLPRPVAGGTADLSSGILRVENKIFTFDGTEPLSQASPHQYLFSADTGAASFEECLASHFAPSPRGACSKDTDHSISVSPDAFWFYSTDFQDAQSLNHYLAAQAQLGQPLQVLYRLENPEEMQISKNDFFASSSPCAFSLPGGEVTVRGFEDPGAMIREMKNKIASLEKAALNL